MIYRQIGDSDVQLSIIGLGGHEYLDNGTSRGFNEDFAAAVRPDDLPAAAGGLELGGLRARVVAEHGGLVHLAMQQADALAALQVDGGVEDHDSGISCFGASVSLRFL